MAAKTAAPVGSAAWIASEKENVLELLQQEKEELTYPAQHEIEWLNEHMAEIFSRNQFNVTDVFKTPGKLRGKTPRTARKRIAVDARIPLSDVFSSKPHIALSPAKPNRQYGNAPQFNIAQDVEDHLENETTQQQAMPNSMTDSGYHGSSQDCVEEGAPATSSSQHHDTQTVLLRAERLLPLKAVSVRVSEGRRTTEGSFQSAKEEQTGKIAAEALKDQLILETLGNDLICRDPNVEITAPSAAEKEAEDPQNDFDDIGSPSDESTPDRPLVRKSSLNFASLPAREPLNRTSRTSHLDHARTQKSTSHSVLAKQHHAQTTTQHEGEEEAHDVEMNDNSNIEILGHDESDSDSRAARQYSKKSTQRLQEKIDMLGKAAPRPSKSIPSAATLAAYHLRQSEAASKLEKSNNTTSAVSGVAADDEDDWIKPLKSPESGNRAPLTKSHTTDVMDGIGGEMETDEENEFDVRAPELIAHEERMRTPEKMSPSPGKSRPGFLHAKSASTATLVSPGKAAAIPPKSPAQSMFTSNQAYGTTTPHGSPKRFGGHLSASKSKLQSIMKTAKGLFTSSAGVSAAAKMETLSPNALRLAANNIPSLYPNLNAMLDDKPLPASPPRKTRSSTEREKEARVIQKMDDQLQKVREKERQKAAQSKEAQEKGIALKCAAQPTRVSPRRLAEEHKAQDAADMPPPAVQPQSKLGRPTRPIRENSAKPKPQPVSIRVGTLSQRMPVSTQSLAANLQETLPAEPKRPGLSKKISNASLQSSSSSAALKASVSSQPAKPKALLAAERKREQDEREARRKLEQKKETERRRAAQQEEARRQELEQRAEADRKERERVATEQAKRQVQQQAIEKKRFENTRKVEQQRAADAAAARPQSRLGSAQPLSRSLIGHALPTNPAKPAKRPLEDDTGTSRPQASRFGAATQPGDGKRRKTDDEDAIEVPRPTMSGAPIRQSNLGKKPSIFNHSAYAQVAQPHLGQFPQPPAPRIAHPSVMAQYGNGAKIPFADVPNPSSHATKTPVSAYQQRTLQLVKSSPHYQNGEAIHLPEIPTDSEDEDSDDGGNAFPIPDWATPGHLTDQLIRQEGIDGDAVFGPIAPLKMEEIFAKGNKERLKRMRDRTSSANWAMSGDGLTLEEVRIDKEQRERMRVEGGWRYGNGN